MTQSLYRGMTADQLLLQYSPRRSLPEAPQVFQSWKQRSADFRARACAKLDISYGSNSAARLDLFLPQAPKPPLHVYVHGGYRQLFGKDDFSFIAEGLTQAGIAVAVVGYPLCPTVPISGVIRHARLALAFLWREAKGLGLSGEKIQISGHSAGAHLCAMLVATLWPKVEPEMPADIIASAMLISGVYELEPLRHIEIGEALRLTAALARRHSPITLHPASKARLLLCTGGQESAEFKRQTSALARLWAQEGSPLEVISFPMRNHYTILEELALPRSALVRRALDMLEA